MAGTAARLTSGRPAEAGAFTNWSGSIRCTPRHRPAPRDHAEVAELVATAADRGRTVRPVGSGHSSTPIIATDDVLVSLDQLRGLVAHDTAAGRATVLPGTGLADLGAELEAVGLALENFGDVDYQAIAGAIGTATHGTGERIGNLSSTLVGGTLVTGEGHTRRFGTEATGTTTADPEDSDLLRAAQVGLGTLGILTSLTLRVVPAYELRRVNVKVRTDWVLEHFDELAATYRHVDFYWYPRSDIAQLRVLDEPARMAGLELPGEVHRDRTGPSYEVLPNTQEARYEEIEYMLPREAGLAAFRHVRQRIKERHRAQVAWRVLVRTVAPDQAMLSNAQDRPTMTIALLHNAELPYQEYFGDLEPLFLGAGGRPHWGKKHTRRAAQLRRMYPDWDRFNQIRRSLDPAGVFMTDYLRELLEDHE